MERTDRESASTEKASTRKSQVDATRVGTEPRSPADRDLGIDATLVRRAMSSTATPPSVMAAGRVQRAVRPADARSSDGRADGLPDHLRSGIEQLSGISMGDVQVHYDSARPAQVGALAYASSGEIHIAPGQEEHLPHEAWHVVQQAQGRVRATAQLKSGAPVNDSDHLEREADVMGARALAIGARGQAPSAAHRTLRRTSVVQREDDRETALQKLKKENMDVIRKIRDRIKNYRKAWNTEVNAGTNKGKGWEFTTLGGTKNPVKLNRGDPKWKFRVTDVAEGLDGSDSGMFKKRYEHKDWSNILIHVE